MATPPPSNSEIRPAVPNQQQQSPSNLQLPRQFAGVKRSPSPAANAFASIRRSPSPVVGIGRSPSPASGLLGTSTSSSGISSGLTVSNLGSGSGSGFDVQPSPPKRKRTFHRELKYMMHGFGDDPNPYTETVDLVEDLVVEFIAEMTLKAMEVGKSGKVHVNDIMFILRKDPKKYARVNDLLRMNEELKKARRAFDDADTY